MQQLENNLEQAHKQLKFSELTDQIVKDIVALYVSTAEASPELAKTVTLDKIKNSLSKNSTVDFRLGSSVLGTMHTKLRIDLADEVPDTDDMFLKIFIFPNVDQSKENEGKELNAAFQEKLQEYLASL